MDMYVLLQQMEDQNAVRVQEKWILRFLNKYDDFKDVNSTSFFKFYEKI